jgi:cytochrome c biogenesis protein CcmG/thiol:disulfide interchange protein DsbE
MINFGRVILLVITFIAFNAMAVNRGEPVPALELAAWQDANPAINLQGLHGKILYIDFWASWCVPCKKSFPFMNTLREKYSAEELQILAINMDEYRADAEKFLKNTPALFTLLQGNAEVAKAFDIPGLPTAYLIDINGMIVARHTGFNKKSAKKTIQQIEFLLAKD